ncbi:MAG: hypothetical protein P4M08_01245 [Oligoflexia bacterium]|nr:hypothetical protein [Oligoflexia bacterium]
MKKQSEHSNLPNLRCWLPLWVIAVMIVMAIGTVWLRLSIIRTTYAIDQVDRQMHALQQAREQMDIKITALRSPRRLELIAHSKFGLVPPRAEQFVHLPAADSGAVSGAVAQ